MIVYFSNVSNNTHRFVQKLETESLRIPVHGEIENHPNRDYLLFTPTYGNGSVPPQVVRFLNSTDRQLIKGVVGSGNTNFGDSFCLAGYKLSNKLQVPLLYKFELMGNKDDIEQVQAIMKETLYA